MKKIHVISALLLCILAGSSFLENDPGVSVASLYNEPASMADTFPVPPHKGNRAFYVQRTHNTNTIVYDLNYNADSTLNEKDPVHAYWIRYADKGESKELSYLQKNYAYGVNAVSLDNNKQTYKVNFVSYKKRDIYLVRSKSGHLYQACININNKLSYLSRIFVKIDGGTFWLPHVTYVEVTGRDIASGKPVSEKIIT